MLMFVTWQGRITLGRTLACPRSPQISVLRVVIAAKCQQEN